MSKKWIELLCRKKRYAKWLGAIESELATATLDDDWVGLFKIRYGNILLVTIEEGGEPKFEVFETVEKARESLTTYQRNLIDAAYLQKANQGNAYRDQTAP